MKNYSSLLKLLLAAIMFSISLTSWAQEKFGYQITLKLGNIEDEQILLAYYLGSKTYIKDTGKVENNKVVFEGKEPLPAGIYKIAVGKNYDYAEFLVDEYNQKFKLSIDRSKDGKNIYFSNIIYSKENEIFRALIDFITKKRKESEQIDSSNKAALNKIDQEVLAYRDALIKNEPNSFTATLIKAGKEVDIPEALNNITDAKEREVQRYLYYKHHFFDNINMSDERLIRTPILASKMDYYLNKLTVQHQDSINISIDHLVTLSSKNKETYKNCIIYSTNLYANSKVSCYDACYVHCIDTYYTNSNAPFGGAFWLNDAEKEKCEIAAEKLRLVLCNVTAPNLMLSSLTEANTSFSLNSIRAKYTVLLFWSNTCRECDDAISMLKENYVGYKARGIEIVGIAYTYDDSKIESYKEYIKNKNIPWINAIDDNKNYGEAAKKYKIYKYPICFLLDENKKIIFKNLTVESIVEYFKNK